jgi:hypothetical protein
MRGDDGFDDVGGVSPLLGPVGGIDRVGLFLGLDQSHVFGDAEPAVWLPSHRARRSLGSHAGTALSTITPSDWRLAILGGLFVVCGGVGLWFLNAPYEGSTQLFAVAGASGATAPGILVPIPKLKSSA